MKYPFIGAIVGSGVAAAYVSFFKVKAVALGTAGLPGFISINGLNAGWLHYFIGMLIAFSVTFIITVLLSFRKTYRQQN